MNANLAAVLYLVAGVLFILSLRGLSSPASSRRGNFLGMAGMAIAVATTLAAHPPADGIAWVLVVLGVAIGGSVGSVIAFAKLSGRMSGAPILLPARHVINIALGVALVVFIVRLVMTGGALDFWLITIIALVLGGLLIIPIGGADMPVVISMLNSYSGWAAAGIGFTLGNSALIITGALVGSSGAILSYI